MLSSPYFVRPTKHHSFGQGDVLGHTQMCFPHSLVTLYQITNKHVSSLQNNLVIRKVIGQTGKEFFFPTNKKQIRIALVFFLQLASLHSSNCSPTIIILDPIV